MISPEPIPYTPRGGASYLKQTLFDHSPAHRNRLACIVRMLERAGGDPKTTKVIEVGCGLGYIAIPIASLGYPVTAIDVHGPSLAAARRRSAFRNLEWILQPAEHADFSPYDVIILTKVLEHTRNYRALMQHVAEGMKAGARVILTVPNGRSLTERLCRPAYAMKPSRFGSRIVEAVKWVLHTKPMVTTHEPTPPVSFFTLPALDKLFAEVNLKPVLFHRFFDRWLFRETFFSERGVNERKARRDFERSQRLPPERCALWAFLLEKAD